MSISDAGAVDALGIDPDTGDAMMVISDDLDWSDPMAHINALQVKIGDYIGFMNSGQLEQHMPEAAGRKRRIAVFQQYEPPAQMMQILDGLGEQLEAFDIAFGYGPLPDGFEQPA
jgi:hypothetical protein